MLYIISWLLSNDSLRHYYTISTTGMVFISYGVGLEMCRALELPIFVILACSTGMIYLY